MKPVNLTDLWSMWDRVGYSMCPVTGDPFPTPYKLEETININPVLYTTNRILSRFNRITNVIG